MKLVTSAQQLRSALNLFRNIIETRNTYPVLGTVLFDGSRVRGTNLDMELVVTLVASEASGKIAIDYRSLSRLVALIPSDDVVTILGGKDNASVLFSSGRYDLPCCDPDAYPNFKWSGQGAIDAIPANGLRDALAFAAPAIGSEETRYYLNGVSFQRDKKGTSLVVATNGHQLAAVPFGTNRWIDGKIVPRQAVSALMKMVEPLRVERLPYDALGATISAVHADFGTGREFLAKAVVANVGAEQTVSFRSDYMITLLRNFARHDRVRLDIIDANSPMRVSAGGDAYTILMPMRGANEKLALDTLHEVTAMGRAA